MVKNDKVILIAAAVLFLIMFMSIASATVFSVKVPNNEPENVPDSDCGDSMDIEVLSNTKAHISISNDGEIQEGDFGIGTTRTLAGIKVKLLKIEEKNGYTNYQVDCSNTVATSSGGSPTFYSSSLDLDDTSGKVGDFVSSLFGEGWQNSAWLSGLMLFILIFCLLWVGLDSIDWGKNNKTAKTLIAVVFAAMGAIGLVSWFPFAEMMNKFATVVLIFGGFILVFSLLVGFFKYDFTKGEIGFLRKAFVILMMLTLLIVVFLSSHPLDNPKGTITIGSMLLGPFYDILSFVIIYLAWPIFFLIVLFKIKNSVKGYAPVQDAMEDLKNIRNYLGQRNKGEEAVNYTIKALSDAYIALRGGNPLLAEKYMNQAISSVEEAVKTWKDHSGKVKEVITNLDRVIQDLNKVLRAEKMIRDPTLINVCNNIIRETGNKRGELEKASGEINEEVKRLEGSIPKLFDIKNKLRQGGSIAMGALPEIEQMHSLGASMKGLADQIESLENDCKKGILDMETKLSAVKGKILTQANDEKAELQLENAEVVRIKNIEDYIKNKIDSRFQHEKNELFSQMNYIKGNFNALRIATKRGDSREQINCMNRIKTRLPGILDYLKKLETTRVLTYLDEGFLRGELNKLKEEIEKEYKVETAQEHT